MVGPYKVATQSQEQSDSGSLSLSLCVSLYSISSSMNRETPTVKEFFNLHGVLQDS